MKKHILIAFIFTQLALAQETKFTESEISVNQLIKGTLYAPGKSGGKTDLVILIAGSGPTNRSGNQVGMKNNSLKYLAQGIAKGGTAVFSYDKRIFAMMVAGNLDEKSLRFEDFIGDAKDVIAFFRNKKEYRKIIVAGHSEGALIGVVAAQDNRADAYISLAGAGRTIDQIIADQIAQQAPGMRTEVEGYFTKMRNGEDFQSHPMLESVFRESVRPYLLSSMKYDAKAEIKKLKIPVLIVNGTKDLQIKVDEAQALKAAKPDAKLVLIENMNHVLKEIKGDDAENQASYSNPDLPVMDELISAVNQFIKTI